MANSENVAHFFREMVVKQETTKRVETLEKNTHFSWHYFLLAILSSLISTIGILQNNVIVFFIGLSIAPYLVYLSYVVVGVFMKNFKLFLASLKGFFGAFLLQVFCSAILGFFLMHFFSEVEISPANFVKYTDPGNPLNILGTFLLGFSTLYCFLRMPKMEYFSGVGVSFFLIPTLVLIGSSLVIKDAETIISTSFILLFNLINLILGASAAFLIFGFSL